MNLDASLVVLHDAIEDDVEPGNMSEDESVDEHEEHSKNEAGSHVKRCCHGDTLGQCGHHCKEKTDIPEQKLCEATKLLEKC